MRQFVAGTVLVLTLAGCAAHAPMAPTSPAGWRAWTVNPRTSEIVQEETLAPTYEACQAGNREELAQAEALCHNSANPICPEVLNAMEAARCSPAGPVTVAAPPSPSAMDYFVQALAIIVAARASSPRMVMGPIQWNAYGPGVHMDATGQAVQLVPR
jgi:hypothetical protein